MLGNYVTQSHPQYGSGSELKIPKYSCSACGRPSSRKWNLNPILQIANSYTGITGNTSLDEAGYRKYGDYDFWAVVPNNDHNTFEWKKVGVFKSDANTTYGLTLPISKKLHS